MPNDDLPDASSDVALLCGPSPRGDGVTVLRARDGKVELGLLQPLKDGMPLTAGEVVQLRPRAGNPRVCDVTVQHTVTPAVPVLPGNMAPRTAADGPAQVATDTYRTNWERTFGAVPREHRTLN